MDRLRFELLLGHSGGLTRDPPTGQAGGDDGTGSDDEEMPDRTTEPGPSERLSEEGPQNDDSQTNDDFTVMDVEEEQPEEEAPRPPRRERFEHERSDSMSQGEGTSQQHDEDERSVPKAQRQRQRKRRQESPRKPPVKFRR